MEFDLTTARQALERTPQALRALLAGLSPAWTDATEGPETWSPRMIVVHLIHAERDNWIPRARVVLEHGSSRPFPAFDRSVPLEEFAGVPLSALLDEFVRLRAESLATLASWELGDAELSQAGHHPELGAVMLKQLLATWTAHDLAHLGQVARVMARQYRDAVGPWRVFLPIMDR
jgi:hypothetical protein